MAVKLESEDKMKNQNRDKERYDMQIRLTKKEADIAKEQLRSKIMDYMKLEAKVKQLEQTISNRSSAESQNYSQLVQVRTLVIFQKFLRSPSGAN